MKIAITTETASDMPIELLKKYNVKTVPFGVTIGDEFFYDARRVPMRAETLNKSLRFFIISLTRVNFIAILNIIS